MCRDPYGAERYFRLTNDEDEEVEYCEPCLRIHILYEDPNEVL